MKLPRLFAALLCLILSGSTLARAQDMDTAITKLTEDVAARIKENGNKKVTVLDFMDLQGNTTELGRYLAEQVTVDFVMAKRDFSVLDRANLKRILDEHKLTTTGLVNPENAKKLGMFAGVDAMIFGTIVPGGGNVSVVVKVITTESAEVVGGAKTKFKIDETVQKLLEQPAKAEASKSSTDKPSPPPPPPKPKPFGDLNAKVESFKYIPGDSRYGYVSFSIIINNASATDTYGVAFIEPKDKISVSNSRGEDFDVTELRGIGTVFELNGNLMGTFTDVPPGSKIIITGKGQVAWNGKPGDYRPYRIQTEAFFGVESQGRYLDKKKINLILDTN